MAILENGNVKFLIGLAVGVLGVGVAREILPSFDGLGRPMAKATIKSGFKLFRWGQENMARFSEYVEDLIAEAGNELESESEKERQQSSSEDAPDRDFAKGA